MKTVKNPLSPPPMNTLLLNKEKERDFYNQYLKLFESSSAKNSRAVREDSPNKTKSKSLYEIATSYSPAELQNTSITDGAYLKREDSFIEVNGSITNIVDEIFDYNCSKLSESSQVDGSSTQLPQNGTEEIP